MPNQRQAGREFSVWFYIGVLLLIYGLLLLAAGVYQVFHPPTTVLAGLHATLWGGAVLLLLGAIYVVLYRPGNNGQSR